MNRVDFLLELNRRAITCSREQLDLLWTFMHHVLETNEKFNLTAIKDEDAFVEKMIFEVKYFGKDDQTIRDKIRIVGYVHMIRWNRNNEPENNVRLEGCRTRLLELLEKYDDLDIGL